eukprot:GILJ01019039.1.p1 GENE.GILJ01019039.1~~GILJ01019039.1.p1  ORF type:complete len:646 (-),score=79.59 GILJ01019039.1:117-2009(-)
MAVAKGFFKLLEDAVGGCAWELVGFFVSWSVIQSRLVKSRRKGGWGADKLLSSMIVQRRLVTDFHVAITSMVVNFREVSHLSEFTEKLANFDRTSDSIARGEFARYVGTVVEASPQIATNTSSTGNMVADSSIAQNSSTAVFGNSSFTMGSSLLGQPAASLPVMSSPEREQQEAEKAEEAKEVAKWNVSELKVDGWVPCVMSPALHHATYTSTTTPQAATPILVGANNEPCPSPVDASPKLVEPTHALLVKLHDTDISTPNGKLLVQKLNLSWESGQSWAVSGPNGCGKSSLLRVLAHTWLPSGGEVAVHPKVVFIYVPQTPYFPPDSTLAEQVAYPETPSMVRFEIREEDGARKIFPLEQERSSEVTTSLTAPEDEFDWMVCPVQQRRMRESLQLATGRQLLREVIRGWESPSAGLFNPHQKYRSDTHHHRSQSDGCGGELVSGNEGAPSQSPVASPEATSLFGKIIPTISSKLPGLSTLRSVSPTAMAKSSEEDGNHDDDENHNHQNFEYYYSHGTFSGCDRTLSWSSLSGGQQQKLSLARAFYHSLKAIEDGLIPIVVMDESTSQMDEASEDAVFKNLRHKGVDMLSVSHRKEVVLRHTHILQLARDPAGWRLVEVNENTVNEALEI